MEKMHEINESVYDINMDNLCQNSIELIKYARNITAKQVNNVQIMTYYSLGRWIVEVQQQGKHRAEYGKKIIINLSKKLTEEFGKGFSESTLEKARKFYLTYKNRISETLFTEFAIKKSETVFTIFEEDRFRVDLVFYNRLLKCFVLFDLKIGKLKHQDLGQMQMYVNYYDRYEKTADENPTIGVLLCNEKNDAMVELTLPEDSNIYASQYKRYLPDKKLLQDKLKEWLQEEGGAEDEI